MKKLEVKGKIREIIENLLNDIPFVQIGRSLRKEALGDFRPDLLLEVTAGNRRRRIVVEVKSPGEQRQVRSAIQQLKEYLSQFEDIYGVVGAPYISGDAARICKENGIGYTDLAGNCFLNFDQIYIERKNFPNPNVERRPLRSLFTPKSSRILRAMLCNPKRAWQVQEIAKETEVSLGLVFKVKQRLFDLEYAKEEDRKISLSRPMPLLEKWAESYSFRKNRIYDYFGFGELSELEGNIAEYCRKKKIPYALTLFSGAARVAPFARYGRGFVYVAERIQEVAKSAGLKEVSSGPNLSILEPYDQGVFYGSREIGRLSVACDIQLYLDLVGYRGRGEESANFLLKQRIEPRW